MYATRHGCTEKCALELKNGFKKETEILNLKKVRNINLDNYDNIIIGGSIHIGKIQKKVKQFCLKNLDLLKTKRIGLFICCMAEGEEADSEFKRAFPEELIQHATATGIFGGEFNFEKMNFIERAMIKKIAKVDKSVFKVNKESITKFIQQINENVV